MMMTIGVERVRASGANELDSRLCGASGGTLQINTCPRVAVEYDRLDGWLVVVRLSS